MAINLPPEMVTQILAEKKRSQVSKWYGKSENERDMK